MKIDILCFGSLKKTLPFSEIFNFYKDRIKTSVNVVEMKTFDFAEKKKIVERKKIMKHLKSYEYIFILDGRAKAISSEEFAKKLKRIAIDGLKKICFVVGSETGLDKYFVDSFDSISFGKQTWPHQLIRIMLIEQIYRAFEIIKGSSYHK